MMKSILFMCICAAIVTFPAVSNAADFNAEFSVGGYSSYIWRGFRLTDEALQIQPSATLSVGGFSANVWAEYDSDTGEWLEVDYTAAYGHSFDMVNLELGYIHYDIRDGLDSDEVYLSAGLDIALNPTLTVYVDVNEGEGAFLVGGISHPVELTSYAGLEFGASLSMIIDNGYIATDRNGEAFTDLFNAELTAAASIAMGDHFSIDPMIGYTTAISDDASDAIKAANTDGDDAFFYGGIALTASF